MAEAESPEETRPSVAGEEWADRNWLLIGVFTLLTAIGVVISTGRFGTWMVEIPGEPATDSGIIVVPLYVYLYASLGALGYVFTRLMAGLDDFNERNEFEELVEMGLRIPAAWVLGAGVYLLFGEFAVAPEFGDARLVAGVAFLVGLYVNVAFKSLGSVADRVLGRPRRS